MGKHFLKIFKTVPKTLKFISAPPAEAENTDVLASYKDDKTYESKTSKISKREFHSEKKASYWLPKDEEEQHRLTGQHFAIKELFEGNILPKVHDIIDFEKGVSVLDVGCGSGVWIMDMFNDYPNCTYEGCDIVDIAYKTINLKQINYSFGNVAEGLKYPDNTFDFVYMRLLIFALKREEWPVAIKELLRVTKPGGVVQLVENDTASEGGPMIQKLGEGIRIICELRDQDPDIASKLEDMFKEIDECKIIQVDVRNINFAGDEPLSKKFRWDFEKAAASIIPFVGHRMGLETKKKQELFLMDLHTDFLTTEGHASFRSIAVQKKLLQ